MVVRTSLNPKASSLINGDDDIEMVEESLHPQKKKFFFFLFVVLLLRFRFCAFAMNLDFKFVYITSPSSFSPNRSAPRPL